VLARPTHVVFDLDGTLTDSSPGILASFRHTLAQIGRTVPDQQLRTHIGPPLEVSFATLGVASEDVDDVVAMYRQYYGTYGVLDASLYEHVPLTLEGLATEGVHLAVATSKRVDFARQMLEHFGLADRFEIIAGASLDRTVSEKFEIIDEVLTAWQRTGSPSMWMVGDRRFDVHGALRHAMTPVGVTWGFGSREELLESGAVLLIDDPRELLR
jgi:phosphoglycolate phosphatase